MRTGRNDPCPCGSGRKFKKCKLRNICKPEHTCALPPAKPLTERERRRVQMNLAIALIYVGGAL